jgi:cytochrome c peroxidase
MRVFGFLSGRLATTGLGLMGLGLAVVGLSLSTVGVSLASGGGSGGGGGGLAPLSSVAIPQAVGGDIKDMTAAVQLGKALFWDEQVGGDGKQACATCHFQAGADSRLAVAPNGAVGSIGDVPGTFNGLSGGPADNCTYSPGAPRQVTGRNAPSVINAVYNRDNFWDGRANHNFNRTDPFGATNNAGIVNGALVSAFVIGNGSLASQADGPPDNPVEMSCNGRHFNGSASLGHKLLNAKPLFGQQVSSSDSVLGALADPNGGLNTSYQALITQAFTQPLAGNAESQFTSIFGQAVQAYESTLVSDRTPLDQFLAGNRSALTANQQTGLNVFQSGKGNCAVCHAGPEMTDASINFFARNGALNRDGGDQGFHNDGVSPTAADLGRAGSGPGGQAWSVSGSSFDRGAFKTPGLRNVGLNGPYFHDGSARTLTDVVNFYARGGTFANAEKSSLMKTISFSASDVNALVDFLQNGLTDCRVARQSAPFDHPALSFPDGSLLPATGGGSC